MSFSLNPVPKVISFDCYGTLVRWREVLHQAIGTVLRRHGSPLDPFVLLDTYNAEAKPLQNGPEHLGYKVILRRCYAAAFAKHGVPATAEDIESIVQSIKTMGPHAETVDVLRRLKTRYRLAIFTNSDDDLIVHNVRLLQVPIDHVITAEQAQAYKPSRRIFEHAHRVMGVTKDETVHVAMSLDLDMQACKQLGIRGIWINRLGIPANPDWKPYEELPDLRGLPALLGVA
ncbi:MAG: haloacid dehalogenase type [Rubritepida sp.]|nr:haloacid dehalogenase type [Rubritepida sp.]